jgi:hypothetical protein
LGEGLLAETSRRDVTAVSTDDPAEYGIIVTSSGTEPAAKKRSADFESGSDLLNFLITQKAGAGPAKHAVCFLQIRHVTLLFDLLADDYKPREKSAMNEKTETRQISF